MIAFLICAALDQWTKCTSYTYSGSLIWMGRKTKATQKLKIKYKGQDYLELYPTPNKIISKSIVKLSGSQRIDFKIGVMWALLLLVSIHVSKFCSNCNCAIFYTRSLTIKYGNPTRYKRKMHLQCSVYGKMQDFSLSFFSCIPLI